MIRKQKQDLKELVYVGLSLTTLCLGLVQEARGCCFARDEDAAARISYRARCAERKKQKEKTQLLSLENEEVNQQSFLGKAIELRKAKETEVQREATLENAGLKIAAGAIVSQYGNISEGKTLIFEGVDMVLHTLPNSIPALAQPKEKIANKNWRQRLGDWIGGKN